MVACSVADSSGFGTIVGAHHMAAAATPRSARDIPRQVSVPGCETS